jgi:hypothetical protein
LFVRYPFLLRLSPVAAVEDLSSAPRALDARSIERSVPFKTLWAVERMGAWRGRRLGKDLGRSTEERRHS